MLKNNTIRNIALIVLVMAMLIGVIHLFMLRFQTGDIYPPYSSLRSDPLGARAFYESLKNFNEFTLQRNYHLLHSLKIEPNSTFFHLGSQIPFRDLIPERTSEALDRLTQSGGRLVITYLPVTRKPGILSCSEEISDDEENSGVQTKNELEYQNPEQEKQDATRSQPEPDDSKEKISGAESQKKNLVSIKEHWGFDFAYNERLSPNEKDEKLPTFEAISRQPDLPEKISWHTILYFEIFDDSWQTLYTVDGNPVIIERAMGTGSIVLCADSYFISNEALRTERHPQLLAWLLGRNSNLIFDESHFGLYKHEGVAGLLLHYQFQWVVAALVLVAALFVWKNAVYFVPPRKDYDSVTVEVVSEKDYTQGLTALLRRNISGRKILHVCGHEWEQTFKNDKRIKPAAVIQMKQILQIEHDSAKEKTDPVTGYRKISTVFKQNGIYTGNK